MLNIAEKALKILLPRVKWPKFPRFVTPKRIRKCYKTPFVESNKFTQVLNLLLVPSYLLYFYYISKPLHIQCFPISYLTEPLVGWSHMYIQYYILPHTDMPQEQKSQNIFYIFLFAYQITTAKKNVVNFKDIHL